MNKTIILSLTILLLTSIATAMVDWTIPSEANLNSNFKIEIFGSSMYGVEITLPEGFEVVLDRSNGVVTGNIYRTFYTSDLDITLRSTEIGDFTLTGEYTQGEGVNNLGDKNIEIMEVTATEITCPECPIDEEWSECMLEKQKRNTYVCSAETNFICQSTEEERECQEDTIGIQDSTQEVKKGFFRKIESAFISSGNAIGSFFKSIWDKIIFWN